MYLSPSDKTNLEGKREKRDVQIKRRITGRRWNDKYKSHAFLLSFSHARLCILTSYVIILFLFLILLSYCSSLTCFQNRKAEREIYLALYLQYGSWSRAIYYLLCISLCHKQKLIDSFQSSFLFPWNSNVLFFQVFHDHFQTQTPISVP